MTSGTFVSYANGKMILSHGGGAKNTTHSIKADAKVLINGTEAKLADLEDGDSVTLDTDPATSVSAAR